MARETWVWRNGEMVVKGGPHDPGIQRGPTSDLPSPQLIRDSLPDLKGMHDGRIYDSRSNMYKAYKQAGVRVVEQGEGPAQPQASKISKAEVAEAYGRVKQGYKPAPLPTNVLPD